MALQAVNRGESLSDRAYRMLRNAILSGELAPGERPHGAGCGIIFITETSFIFGWPNARATISWLR